MVDLMYVFLAMLLAFVFFAYLLIRKTVTEYRQGVDRGSRDR